MNDLDIRLQALQLAVSSRDLCHDSKEIVNRAKEFYEFLQPSQYSSNYAPPSPAFSPASPPIGFSFKDKNASPVAPVSVPFWDDDFDCWACYDGAGAWHRLIKQPDTPKLKFAL